MARPKKEINETALKQMAAAQCTMKEMAENLSCSVDTLERHYADLIRTAREGGKAAIRMHQFRLMAKKDSTQMAIFLGEEYLGQGKKTISSESQSSLDKLVDWFEKRKPD